MYSVWRRPTHHFASPDLRGVLDERHQTPYPQAASALAAVTALGAVAACGDDSGEGTSAGGKPDKLVVETFGEFGYDDLVKQYEQDTGIKVELRKTAQLNEYRPKIVRSLATGKGVADVVALEEGILNEFKTNPRQLGRPDPAGRGPQHRVPALEVGARQGRRRPADRPAHRRRQPRRSATAPTCSRPPACPPSATPSPRCGPTGTRSSRPGKKYRETTGKGMLDSVTTAASAIMLQAGGDLFYDAENNIVADKSPAVKQAWDTSLQDGRRQHHREDGHLVAGVERRLQAGHVRRDLLSVVDARHRRGQLRRGEQGQVGRRRRAGRRRQLGRLVARPCRAGQAQGRGRQAGRVPDHAAQPGGRVQAQGPAADQPRRR